MGKFARTILIERVFNLNTPTQVEITSEISSLPGNIYLL